MLLLKTLSQRCEPIRFGDILETGGFSKKDFRIVLEYLVKPVELFL
jgi:hypothetical protein